jgi:hypothetical protein
MQQTYLRLECRVRRRNRVIPCVFLIDATREPYMAAVFDPRTGESLDHRKVRNPRPLKTHAYNFSHIEDLKGRALVEKRAENREEAESFVRALTKNAVPMTRNEYFAQLESIVWPPPQFEGPAVQGEVERAVRAGSEPPQPFFSFGERAAPASFKADNLPLALMMKTGAGRQGRAGPAASERKALIREIIRLLEMMDLDDLRELLRFSRMMLDE